MSRAALRPVTTVVADDLDAVRTARYAARLARAAASVLDHHGALSEVVRLSPPLFRVPLELHRRLRANVGEPAADG